jgi:hypothetical protein
MSHTCSRLDGESQDDVNPEETVAISLHELAGELRNCTFWLAESVMVYMSSLLPRIITSSAP